MAPEALAGLQKRDLERKCCVRRNAWRRNRTVAVPGLYVERLRLADLHTSDVDSEASDGIAKQKRSAGASVENRPIGQRPFERNRDVALGVDHSVSARTAAHGGEHNKAGGDPEHVVIWV